MFERSNTAEEGTDGMHDMPGGYSQVIELLVQHPCPCEISDESLTLENLAKRRNAMVVGVELAVEYEVAVMVSLPY